MIASRELVGELEIEEVQVDIGGRVISDVGLFLSCHDPLRLFS